MRGGLPASLWGDPDERVGCGESKRSVSRSPKLLVSWVPCNWFRLLHDNNNSNHNNDKRGGDGVGKQVHHEVGCLLRLWKCLTTGKRVSKTHMDCCESPCHNHPQNKNK